MPTGNLLYGNVTGAVDLSFYRDDIMTLTANPVPVPEPSVALQLAFSAGFLSLLQHRRRAKNRSTR